MTQFIDKSTVLDALDAAGLDPEATLYEGYSGRFMYGVKTFGLVGTASEISRALTTLTRRIDEGAALALANAAQQDDMGVSRIIYFPGYNLTED